MIIAVVGPTGVGKTKMSVALAKKYNAEIISCDSMQIYKKMDIGTAKVTEEEKEGIKHHLIDIRDVNDDYSVYDYQKDARKILDDLLNKYEKIDVQSVISFNNKVYMLRYGTYSNLDEMYEKVTNVDRYIYIEKEDGVSAYVGVSTTKKNANKIKDVYLDKKIELTVEEVTINNDEFIQNLNEYEKLLDATEDEKSLLIIENQILSCYEETVVNNE